jgi:hypothetical protein
MGTETVIVKVQTEFDSRDSLSFQLTRTIRLIRLTSPMPPNVKSRSFTGSNTLPGRISSPILFAMRQTLKNLPMVHHNNVHRRRSRSNLQNTLPLPRPRRNWRHILPTHTHVVPSQLDLYQHPFPPVPHTFVMTVLHPTESPFVSAGLLSVGTIIIECQAYGAPKTGD